MAPAQGVERLRLAYWDIGLTRDGPGILLRDITRGDEADIAAAVAVLVAMDADIVVLSSFDTDAEGRTLRALADALDAAGAPYPYRFTRPGNEGWWSGVDLNGDGLVNTPRDRQGFGRFPGNGGLAVLSRREIDTTAIRDHNALLWRDLPGALIAEDTLPEGVAAVQRLSSSGHWIVPVGPLTLMIYAATPPVFDGPEDRNGRRNHDETRLWQHVLDGAFGAAPDPPFAIVGKSNLDPVDGAGRGVAMQALLNDPRVQDPAPRSEAAAREANPGHSGDPALDTANWDDPVPGNLRVDYILPSADLEVLDAGMLWPGEGSPVAQVSRHAVIWVDLALPESR